MGDASINIEKELLNNLVDIKADILKIGHHGSDTSSLFQFLEKVNPRTAIISVGKNNKYGHPSSKVLNNLKKLNIEIKRTDQLSSISYYFNF